MIFEFKSSKQKNINLFLLSGELIDRNQAKKMLEEIDSAIANGENRILLNLEALNYINSSGLNVLINILTKARNSGGEVVICCVNKKITELLVITKLDSIFNMSENIEKAIEILNKKTA